MAKRARGLRPHLRWLPFPFFRVQNPARGIGLPACCVANHLLAAPAPGSEPHHLRAALLVQTTSSAPGCSGPGPGAGPAPRCCSEKGFWSWAGSVSSRLLAGLQPLGPGGVQPPFPWLIGIGWSAKGTPAADPS